MMGEDNDLQQKEIIEVLEQSKPRFIIFSHMRLVDGKWVEELFYGRKFEDYAGLLKKYIQAHYQPEEWPTLFQVWKLRPAQYTR
jgi:hypothetical protein